MDFTFISLNATVCLGAGNNGITDEGAKALAAAISSPSSRIMTLQLANNQIGEVGAVALLEAARRSGTLTTVDLRGNNAAMRAKRAQPAAFKEELGCNLLLIHGLGPNWPMESTAKSQKEVVAALQVCGLSRTSRHSRTDTCCHLWL